MSVSDETPDYVGMCVHLVLREVVLGGRSEWSVVEVHASKKTAEAAAGSRQRERGERHKVDTWGILK